MSGVDKSTKKASIPIITKKTASGSMPQLKVENQHQTNYRNGSLSMQNSTGHVVKEFIVDNRSGVKIPISQLE